jgi:hypothetical protein
MISNIIDRRKRQHRWEQITAITEPTYHDNFIDDSDEAEIPNPDSVPYDERAAISVGDAIAWASSLPFAATLYLYDLGDGIKNRTS